MQVPLQIIFKNLEPSDAIAARIRGLAAELDEFYGRIISCRVTVELPNRRHRTGNHFAVRIDLRVPNREIVVSRQPPLHGAHEDAYVALHDAFDEARRELEDFARRSRWEVKTHASPAHGYVARVIDELDGGYGFIRTEDGREIYFHRNSVLHDQFDTLAPGTEVRFAEEMGDEGPQASTVEIVGKQGKHFQGRFHLGESGGKAS